MRLLRKQSFGEKIKDAVLRNKDAKQAPLSMNTAQQMELVQFPCMQTVQVFAEPTPTQTGANTILTQTTDATTTGRIL